MDELGGLSPLVCREAALFAAGDPLARIDERYADETAENKNKKNILFMVIFKRNES